jgi:hypothetical protein
MEARLTPESQQMLGTAPEAPQKKTRFSQHPVEPRSVAKEEKAAVKAETKKANTPPPPDATEVATQAVNSAPLGLKGDTAAKPKPVATGEKQRFEDKKTEVASTTVDAPQPATQEKKRHKLLGII